MDRRLTIELELRRDHARQQARAMVGELNQVTRAAERAEAAMRRVGAGGSGRVGPGGMGASRAHDAHIREKERADRQYQRLIEQAGRAELRTRSRNSADRDRLIERDQRRYEGLVEKAGQAELRRRSATAAARDAQTDRERRTMEREVEKAGRAELRARSRMYEARDRETKRSQAAYDREVEKAGRAELRRRAKHYDDLDRQQRRAFAGGTRLMRNLGGMAAGIAGIGTAAASVRILEDYIRSADGAVRDAVQNLKGYREELSELGALKDLIGRSDEQVRQELQIQRKTLQTPQEARQFQQSMRGIGESSIGRFISQPEFDRLAVMSGSLQAARGDEAEAVGQLAGQIPGVLGRQTTADEVFRLQSQLTKIAQPGGSTFSSGVTQLMGNAGLVQTGVWGQDRAQGLREMAAVQSAFSLYEKEGAGEMVEQFTRATAGAIGRMRGAPMMEQAGSEVQIQKQGEYLRDIGVSDQMTPFQIGKQIADDMARQRKVEEDRGRTMNPYVYLRSKGYANQQDIKTLLIASSMQESGQLAGFMNLATPGAMPTMAEAVAPITAFRADPRARARETEIATKIGEVGIGAGPAEYYENLFNQTFARMQGEGRITGKAEDYRGAGITSNPFAFQQRKRIEAQMIEMLESRRAEKGLEVFGLPGTKLKPGENLPMTPDVYQAWTEPGRAQAFFQSAKELAGEGGQIYPDSDAVMKAADSALKLSEALTDVTRKLVQLPDEFTTPAPGGPNATPPKGPLPAPGKPVAAPAP